MEQLLGFIALAIAGIGLTTAIVKFAMDIYRTMTSTEGVLNDIHILVNSRLDEALSRIDQLTGALESAGIIVPTAPVGDRDGG